MMYDKNIETKIILSLNTPQARFGYYWDVMSSRFLTDTDKTELTNVMIDKHPSFNFESIFKNGYSIWDQSLRNELIKLGQPQTTQERALSSSIIMSLIEKYSEPHDKHHFLARSMYQIWLF